MPIRLLTTLLLASLTASLAGGCSPSEQATSPSAHDDYVLVTLKRGPGAPGRSDAERQAIQAAHLENIGRLARERKLVVAGPYGKVNHDPTSRGIFILDVRTLDEARALTNTDPAVIAGVLTMELETLRTNADLRGALEAELSAEAEAKQAGRERPMSEGIRAYVLVRADDGAKAQRALDRMLPPNKTVLAGRIDNTRGFFIIDAPDAPTARGWIGKEESALGPYTLDEWYGSALLVRAAG